MLRYKVEEILDKVGLIRPKLVESRETWQGTDQQYEYEFHEGFEFFRSDDFDIQTRRFFSSFGYTSDQFAGKTVIDIGAGSKMRGKFFEDITLVVIEPLADRFLTDFEWSDLADAQEIYSVPAEELVEDVVGRADFIFSINTLDHCFDFEQVIRNIYGYLVNGGTTFLSFDSHFHPTPGHPLILTDRICREVFIKTGFEIETHSKGFPLGYKDDHSIKGYDLTSTCLNYWLRKPL